jgi:ABC-type enterobactin transport system permease subunit
MGTRIIVGALLTDFAIIIAALMYIGARNPKNTWWGGENAMNWILPLVTGAIVTGPCLLIEGFIFNFNALGSMDITIGLTILGAGAAILFLMRIPKWLAEFEAAVRVDAGRRVSPHSDGM